MEATAPGDIIIGGIFPIHGGVKTSGLKPGHKSCEMFSYARFAHSLAMIHAVESVNKSPILGGLTLGYRILDSCSDVTTALRAAESLTSRTSSACGEQPNLSRPIAPVVALIGGLNSEVSIAVARQLTLNNIPQISYGSSAGILSDKTRFPAFMRTIPNGDHQTRAMVQLLSDSGWNWVGVVTTDGNYGQFALNRLEHHAQEAGICVSFREVLPDNLADKSLRAKIDRVITSIHANPRVNVIISFAKPIHMKYIFTALTNTTLGKVWIASDNWASSYHVLDERKLDDIGKVLGFTFKNGNLTSFNRYLEDLNPDSDSVRNNSFLQVFLQLLAKEQPNISNGTIAYTLKKNTYSHSVLSTELAVRAIAKAVARLCASRNCRDHNIQPWELLSHLNESTIEQDGRTYKFDSNGDLNTGYDVILWKDKQRAVDVKDIAAHYSIQNFSFSFTSPAFREEFRRLQNVVSKCSSSCLPGQYKKTVDGQHSCCYECLNCTENHYTNSTDMDQCLRCDEDLEWALSGSPACSHKPMKFFSWRDPIAITLLTVAALGVMLALLTCLLFLIQKDTPVVRAAGGPVSYLILHSLVVSFASSALFVGQPGDLQCQARHILFGLSFTFCVSCILVKSLKTLLAFEFNPDIKAALHRLYRPHWIMVTCVGLQVLVCMLWLVFPTSRPYARVRINPRDQLAECLKGSYVAFAVMLGYIALLALVCFAFAFKGRKLPENYNEAKFITFGMLVYFIAWVIFIPVYITSTGHVYLPAVEMSVILISNYAILCCHYFPKSYIILFKKEMNTRSAFLENIRDYASRDNSISLTHNSVQEGGSPGSGSLKSNSTVKPHGALITTDIHPLS
ncbi:hypothetical protein AAFF_G00241950 [Aldrovandia affinis]|uniref:G-protein coupled receptor family C group 6 member A n=1 Tax=Aldrovandia affinis TaxID=143900 RepID=A0AAD7SUQ7_9TELE|nr:hypothetical protein AAFF_G00241950 [Aldrovandia affinis]